MEFYYNPGSAACRSILLTAKVLKVDLNLVLVDIQKRQQLHRQLSKSKSQYSVPTLIHGEVVLWDSRSILLYLLQKSGVGDTLYPKHFAKKIDEMLYFEMEKLYPSFTDSYYPMIFSGEHSPDPKLTLGAAAAFKILDNLLNNSEFAVGDKLTLADLVLIATVSTFEAMGFDLSPYESVVKWYNNLKRFIPEYQEINEKNLSLFKENIDILSKKLEAK